MNLTGRTILLTGGTRGIGLALVRALAPDNTLIVTGRNPERLAALRAQFPGVHWIAADVGDREQIADLCARVQKEFPSFDILINNAGIAQRTNLRKSTDDIWLTEQIEVNFKGPVRMINGLIPHLLNKSEAAIVNISSGLALIPFAKQPIYSATKAALHSYTMSLREQLRGTNVKVFEVLPPVVDTDMTAGLSQLRKMSAETHAKIVLRQLRRDVWEIRPGVVQLLYWMARLAPQLVFRLMSKA
jgi:uncharacterized oxidoreductase